MQQLQSALALFVFALGSDCDTRDGGSTGGLLGPASLLATQLASLGDEARAALFGRRFGHAQQPRPLILPTRVLLLLQAAVCCSVVCVEEDEG